MADAENIRIYLATNRPVSDPSYERKLFPVDPENRVLPGLSECIGTQSVINGTFQFACYNPRPLKVGDMFAIVPVAEVTQELKKASLIVQDILYVPAQTFEALQRMNAQQEARWLKDKGILESVYDSRIAELQTKIRGIEEEKAENVARFGHSPTLDTMLLHYFKLPPYDAQKR